MVDTDSQLITAVEVLPGNAPDNLGALELVEASEANTGVTVEEAMGDAAYGDGDTRQTFADAGRTLIARVPGRPNRSHFPKEDFRIDLESGSCTCPAGQVTRTIVPAGRRTDQTGRTYRLEAFRFDAAVPVPGGKTGYGADGPAAPAGSAVTAGPRPAAQRGLCRVSAAPRGGGAPASASGPAGNPPVPLLRTCQNPVPVLPGRHRSQPDPRGRQSRVDGRNRLRPSQRRQSPRRWHRQPRRLARAIYDPHFARGGLTDQILLLNKGFPARLLACYDDTNDAVRLSQDPAMRVIVGWQGSERKGASTSEMGRFETEFLTQEDNRQALARMNTRWVERAMAHTLHQRVILDMDSSESPVHGQQEGAAYNGHFECVCYHPLFLFNQFGDCEGAKLRSGNVHSADDWQEVLDPVVERYFTAAVRLLFRADAAFAKPEIYEYLETRQIDYAIRLPANEVLQRKIAHLLTRPTEGPSPKPIVSYHDFTYQAQSWNVSRRVVAKVEWHQGELFPRVGFIVTNLSYPTIGIVRFYNGRGTAEQWIKEGKYALNWTRLSCHKFVANQVRLGLFIMAYNLGNFLRRLVLPESMKHWSLTSLQTRMIKTGGRLVRHARRLVFQLAEVLVSREMLCGILERIGRLRLAPG